MYNPCFSTVQSKSKVICLPRVNGLSTSTCLQPDPAYLIENFMVGVQSLAQGHLIILTCRSGAGRGFELATFRYQDSSSPRSATAAPLPVVSVWPRPLGQYVVPKLFHVKDSQFDMHNSPHTPIMAFLSLGPSIYIVKSISMQPRESVQMVHL